MGGATGFCNGCTTAKGGVCPNKNYRHWRERLSLRLRIRRELIGNRQPAPAVTNQKIEIAAAFGVALAVHLKIDFVVIGNHSGITMDLDDRVAFPAENARGIGKAFPAGNAGPGALPPQTTK